MDDPKNIVIIGAGPAGLTAAYHILKNDKNANVTVLEKQNFVGGISGSKEFNGNIIDFGPHRYHSKSKAVNDFWAEIMPMQSQPSVDDKLLNRKIELCSTGNDPEKTDNVMLFRNRVSRIYFNGKFYDYPISLRFQTFKNLGLMKSLRVGFSYIKSIIWKRPETNLENFFVNRFGLELYKMFFEYYTENLWGVHPSKIDASWGAERVNGVSVFAVLKNAVVEMFHKSNKKEKSLIDSFKYPKFGSGQFWELVAERIKEMGGKILLETSAKKILVANDKVERVVALTKNKQIDFLADKVISSMPMDDLIEALPYVPKKIQEIAKNLPFRNHVLGVMLVDKLSIENTTKLKTINNQVPDVWIYVQDRSVKLGRFTVFNNFSPYMVKDFKGSVLVGLEYFTNKTDKVWNMKHDEFKEFALGEARAIGIIDENTKVLNFEIFKTKKAYPAYFGSYKHIDQVKNYLENIHGLCLIGRNGCHQYNNIDDSILSALIC